METQFYRRRIGQIDNPLAVEWPAIINANYSGFAVLRFVTRTKDGIGKERCAAVSWYISKGSRLDVNRP